MVHPCPEFLASKGIVLQALRGPTSTVLHVLQGPKDYCFTVPLGNCLKTHAGPKYFRIDVFFLPAEGLESPGRLVGTISTNFRQNPSEGFRAMAQNPPKLTSIELTRIEF